MRVPKSCFAALEKNLLFTLIALVGVQTSACSQKQLVQSQADRAKRAAVHIPIDLNGCFVELDKLFPDSAKARIKAMPEKVFSVGQHRDLGMSLRNNWGLWSKSQLAAYFKEKGIWHPDDMSSIVLDSYHRYLNGREIKLAEQIAYYQEYWTKVAQDDLQSRQEEYATYVVGDTVAFYYRYGFVSKAQEKTDVANLCRPQGLIIAKNKENFSIRVRLLSSCGRRGIVSYSNEHILSYNKLTDRLEKPRKKIISLLKAGEEQWFEYDVWSPAE